MPQWLEDGVDKKIFARLERRDRFRRLFSESTPENIAVMGDTDPTAAGTIGLLIDETKEVPNAPPVEKEKNHSVNELRVLQRLRRLADTTTSAHDRRVMDSHQKLICRLPAKDYGTTEFGMSKERRDALVQAGFDSMKTYLAQL